MAGSGSGQFSHTTKFREYTKFCENLGSHFRFNPSHLMIILTVYLERFRRHGYVWTILVEIKFREYRRSFTKIQQGILVSTLVNLWDYSNCLPGEVQLAWHDIYIWTIFAKTKFRKYRWNFTKFRFKPSLVYLDRFRRGWLESAFHLLLPDEEVEGEGGAAQTKFRK